VQIWACRNRNAVTYAFVVILLSNVSEPTGNVTKLTATKNVHGQKYEKLIADAKNRKGRHTRRPAPRANGPFAKPKMFLQVNALNANVSIEFIFKMKI
jgi:hypothetical protein